MQIDGKEVVADRGRPARGGPERRHLDPHSLSPRRLKPYGGCRLCMVEVESAGATRLVASCVYPVEDGLVVRTRSDKIDRIRKTLLELLLAHAPESPQLQALAGEYGADRDRFEKEAVLLRPLRPVRALLRRGEEGACGRVHRPGDPQGDQLHPGDRGRGVRRLQGVLPALPDLLRSRPRSC